ncbi:hypothetical protein MBLNU13_g03993t1 [Cladosporium sp. NU13]
MDIDNSAVLLKHDPEYGVLICLKCRYAVQKSALDSHLLRHKIYREERKRLMASVSNLNLLEPDEVSLPAPSSPALPYMTKFSGFRCAVSQCGHLTVSTKRMKLHWKQAHGSLELPIRDNELAQNVILQTFFRGNKVKYFEVESPHTAEPGSPPSHDAARMNSLHRLDQSHVSNGQQSSTPSIEPHTSLKGRADESAMWMLRYFHHFGTTTSQTLPYSNASPLQERYWQDVVVSKALQHDWLMQGLLAISACHMAVSTADPEARERHCQYEARYASNLDLRAGQSVTDKTAEQMGDQVRCLLHLAETALRQILPEKARSPFQERFIVVLLRSCLRPDSTIMSSPLLLREEEAAENEDLAEGPREGLQTLRTRMFELLGQPANISDALTILKSIELLQEACSSAGPKDSIELCWSSAAAWLKDVPRHFHEMFDDRDPIALLMMTYWSAIMVTRAEKQGCWFLKGVTKAAVLQIAQKLVAEKHPLLPLILDFGGNS